MLARIRLPSRLDSPRGPVSGAAMVAVLRAIDDQAHAPDRDQPLTITAARDSRGDIQPGIAERTGRSSATVRRAIAGLERLALLDVEQHWDQYGRRRNRYLIDWSRIAQWMEYPDSDDVEGWLASLTDGETTDDPYDDTHHGEYSPTAMVTPATHHGDALPPVMVSARTTTSAHSTPPPPPPSAATDDLHAGWGEVGELLRQAGVNAWRDKLRVVREQHGMTPKRAIALCRYFIAHQEWLGIGPGKLIWRIENDSPEIPVCEHWGAELDVSPSIDAHQKAAAEAQLRAMPAEMLKAFAEEVLGEGALWNFQQAGLDADAALKPLINELVKREFRL